MANEPKGAIVFGEEKLSPEMKAEYQRKIAAARGGVNALKGSTPPGGPVERPVIPDFNKIRAEQEASRHGGVGGFPDSGVNPRPPGSPMLRPETAEQIKGLAEASKEAVKPEEPKEEKKTDEEALFDLMDFADQKGEAERLLNNKKRREEIESRCAPMKFEDLLYKNEVQQKIPILPGKFEPTLRSITPDESLFVKRFISGEDQNSSGQYMLEKYNLCLLTCSLLAINDNVLPDHRDSNGEVDDKLFKAKLKIILRKSGYIISDLGVNYVWFDLRVRRLITEDGLKNG